MGQQASQIVLAAIQRSEEARNFVWPRRIAVPQFLRYGPGMTYGAHVDAAFMNIGGQLLRSDVSCTVFINDPTGYEGGELTIHLGTETVRCGASPAAPFSIPRPPNESPIKAKGDTSKFIKSQERTAQEEQGGEPKDPTTIKDNSLRSFGEAVHTVADSTSPAHVDSHGNPLPWNPTSPIGALEHRAAESKITPQQMQKAVEALHAAFASTYGAAAERKAAVWTPPPAASPTN